MELSLNDKMALCALLEQSPLQHAAAAAKELAGDTRVTSTEASLKNLVPLYSLRAERAEERGRTGQGLSELASNLKEELRTEDPDTKVRFHYREPEGLPVVFTDATVTRIFGVLNMPEEKEA